MAGLTAAVRTLIPSSGNGASPVVVEPTSDGEALVDGRTEPVILTVLDLPRARLILDTDDPAGTHDVLLVPLDRGAGQATGAQQVEVVVDGWRFEVELEPEWRARLRDRATRAGGGEAKGGPVELRAIIPGRVVSIDVAVGDGVEAGQRVMVVEAMKMQNELRAPRSGTIGRLAVDAGQTVELGDILLVLE